MIRDPTPERLITGQRRAIGTIYKMLRSLPHRVRFGGGGSGGTPAPTGPCPFDMTLTPNGGNFDLTFFPGKINEFIPINLLNVFTLDGTSTYYAKLDCTSDGKALTGATLQVNTTPSSIVVPTVSTAPTTFNFLIGVISGQTPQKVIECGNIFANPIEAFLADNPNPVIGLSPYIRWWTWDFKIQ